jgi:hypothetical protein
VGLAEVQQLRGAAPRNKRLIFFSLGGYTAEAIRFADRCRIALFRFASYNGRVEPANGWAERILERRTRSRVVSPKTPGHVNTPAQEAPAESEERIRRAITLVRQDGLSVRDAAGKMGVEPQDVLRFAGRRLLEIVDALREDDENGDDAMVPSLEHKRRRNLGDFRLVLAEFIYPTKR